MKRKIVFIIFIKAHDLFYDVIYVASSAREWSWFGLIDQWEKLRTVHKHVTLSYQDRRR